MRKRLVWFSSISILLILSGCAKEPKQSITETSATTGTDTSAMTTTQGVVPTVSTLNGHILFTGIVTFLRDKSPYLAVMPKVTPGTSKNYPSMSIPVHEAFIVVENATHTFSFDSSVTTTHDPGNKYTIAMIDGLTIDVPDIAETSLTWNESDPNMDCWAKDSDNMWAVPHLGKFCTCTPPSSTNNASAIVNVDKGNMRPYVLSGQLWEYKTSDVSASGPKRRLAQVAAWNVTVNKPDIVLHAKNRAGRSIPLLTIRPNSGTDVAIAIGSANSTDLMDALTKPAAAPTPDHHFETYYDACTTALANGVKPPIPHPVGGNCPKDTVPSWFPTWMKKNGSVPGSVNCGPDQWP